MAVTAPGLRPILTLAFGGMAAVLAASLAWLIGHHASNQARQDAGQRLDSIARVASQVLELGLEERARDLDQLAYLHAHTALRLERDGDELFTGLLRTQPAYRWLAYAGSDGRIVQSAGGHWTGRDISAHPWWQQGRDAPQLRLADGREDGPQPHVFSLGWPVPDDSGERGLLLAQFGRSWAAERLGLVLTPARRALGIRLWLLDAEGRVIHAPDDVDAVVPVLSQDRAQRVRWPDGGDYLTVVHALPAGGLVDSGWQVVSRQPVAMAFAPVRALQLWIAFAGVVMTVLFALLGQRLALLLSQPFLRLARAADALPRSGRRSHLPDDGRLREAVQLARSFNHLLDDLHQYQDELEELNITLEAKVEQRTEALDRANQHLTGVLLEREQLMRQLEEQASTDSLTGLLNRRAFAARAQQEMVRAQRQQGALCVAVLDIDHFKKVNDTHGHDTGDAALKATAEACRRTLREVDVLARFGGEEFVVLLPDTPLADALQVAERLRLAIAALRLPLPDGELVFTTSIGVAAVTPGQPLEQALKAADEALYAAKHGGRNRVVAA